MSTSAIARPAAPSVLTRPLPGCADRPEVFQDPLLEEEPQASGGAEDRRRHAALLAAAAATCRVCPLVAPCLYRAVVEHDVAGYAGGTTARQRTDIRRRLGVVVPAEDLDTLAGVTGGSRHVDHDAVLRLRAAYPDESLEALAGRLGCSLSTVKRHLRRERIASTPRNPRFRPQLQDVLAVAAEVTRAGRTGVRAA